MYSVLLVIMYIAFISLGLPDSLLGSAWPVMQKQFDVPLSYAGIVTMTIAAGTIISSLMSDKITRRFGAGLVTAVSVFMTAAALFGFSAANSFWIICLWAIPYGLGAGAVDAALNNFVALHYASRHMSWLHCFWGVGASASPYIMSHYLMGGLGWNGGYRAVALIQMVLTAALFLSIPLWKGKTAPQSSEKENKEPKSLKHTLHIKGVKLVLFTFFSYSALESTAGLWASSYLVRYRELDVESAASFAALFFLGITGGRFLSGFIADKVGDQRLIRFGIFTIVFGIIMTALPVGGNVPVLLGLIVIGLGCAPIYPAIIHSTPINFGKDNSQAIIGIQMASAYTGSTFMPPVFGFIADKINIGLYPLYLLFFAFFMFIMSEKLNKGRRLENELRTEKEKYT